MLCAKIVLEVGAHDYPHFRGSQTDEEQAEELIRFFKNDPHYGGVYLIGGIDPGWRILGGSSRTNSAWSRIYRMFDSISPWDVGRSRRHRHGPHADLFVGRRLAEVKRLRIGYMPTVYLQSREPNTRREEFRGLRRSANGLVSAFDRSCLAHDSLSETIPAHLNSRAN